MNLIVLSEFDIDLHSELSTLDGIIPDEAGNKSPVEQVGYRRLHHPLSKSGVTSDV